MSEEPVKLDIEHLKTTATRGVANFKDPEWIKAFDFYNTAHSKNDLYKRYRPISIGCAPCYRTVLSFVLRVWDSQQQHKASEREKELLAIVTEILSLTSGPYDDPVISEELYNRMKKAVENE